MNKIFDKATCFHKVGEKAPKIHGTEFCRDVPDRAVGIVLHLRSVPIGSQPRRFRSYRAYCTFKFKMADGETSNAGDEGKKSDSQLVATTGPPSSAKTNPQGITVYCRLRPVAKVLDCLMFSHKSSTSVTLNRFHLHCSFV